MRRHDLANRRRELELVVVRVSEDADVVPADDEGAVVVEADGEGLVLGLRASRQGRDLIVVFRIVVVGVAVNGRDGCKLCEAKSISSRAQGRGGGRKMARTLLITGLGLLEHVRLVDLILLIQGRHFNVLVRRLDVALLLGLQTRSLASVTRTAEAKGRERSLTLAFAQLILLENSHRHWLKRWLKTR